MVISIKRLSHTPSCLAFQRIFPKRKHDLKWELSPVNYPKNVRIAIRSLLEYINNIFKSFLCPSSCQIYVHTDLKVDYFSFIYVLGILVKLTGFAGGFLSSRHFVLANQRTILGGVPTFGRFSSDFSFLCHFFWLKVLKLCHWTYVGHFEPQCSC